MKNALNNQVGMLGDMFFMVCSKLEARGHLLHKTGTPPKHFSRECNHLYRVPFLVLKHFQSPLTVLGQLLVRKAQKKGKLQN